MMIVRSYQWGRWGRNRPKCVRQSAFDQISERIAAIGRDHAPLAQPKDYPVAMKPGFFVRMANKIRRFFKGENDE